ncbi:hypothetical protein B5F07_05175 [Lachnoclostridium sp. An169]|uniref:DUF6128 domain-containing protein n=1 Tax=Lachnoclostridium sp. An169 TaxID=1965569 RepID=UPI000B378BA4|nr:DUF6128 domain-containing protein [Lachnoclostridium sp. An169]OUP85083.1 hypothetical protein B5F07_05175 [Lachnoclostridium sp. An169]
MNPGICYLYEYEKSNRKRNIGFVKVARHYQSCILQIHARGIPLGNGTLLELYAFYRDGDYLNATQIAVLTCFNRMVSVRLPIAESHFPEGRSLQQIDGFLIKLPGQNNPIFWMASPAFFPVDPEKLRTPEDRSESPEESPEPESESLQREPAESETELSPDEPADSENAFPPDEPADSENELTPDEPADSENELSPDEPADSENEFPPDESAGTENEAPQITISGSAASSAPQNSSQTEEQNTNVSRASARKIQRSDLSLLPRRFWFLANNSFLLHGYHNYNHLLLVEEDGHMWLGVPGVYDPREARAADLFGFPQFTRTYAPLIELTEDECSGSDDFGHWCRYIDCSRP